MKITIMNNTYRNWEPHAGSAIRDSVPAGDRWVEVDVPPDTKEILVKVWAHPLEPHDMFLVKFYRLL